ncbi:MAG TPA: hypothetical protein V6D22_10540 [Candidatus Obscuribacterales bacterium]
MRKLHTLLSAALMLGMAGGAPAFAADSSMVQTAAWFPVQAAGVATAWVIGTPICVVRRSAVRIHDWTSEYADKIGGHDHFPPVLFASLLAVPFGAVAGTGEGIYYGGHNAIMHGIEHPFSMDSFSLGSDLEK